MSALWIIKNCRFNRCTKSTKQSINRETQTTFEPINDISPFGVFYLYINLYEYLPDKNNSMQKSNEICFFLCLCSGAVSKFGFCRCGNDWATGTQWAVWWIRKRINWTKFNELAVWVIRIHQMSFSSSCVYVYFSWFIKSNMKQYPHNVRSIQHKSMFKFYFIYSKFFFLYRSKYLPIYRFHETTMKCVCSFITLTHSEHWTL